MSKYQGGDLGDLIEHFGIGVLVIGVIAICLTMGLIIGWTLRLWAG